MGKLLTLLLTVILALASAAGYLYLNPRIAAGERQIAEGQRRLEEGRAALEEGRAELEAGERKLSEAEEAYETVGDIPLVKELDGLLGGRGSEEVERRLDEGEERVARGEDSIAAGQERVDAGELALRRGRDRLRLARRIRAAFAVGAAVLGLLAIVLGFRWRQSLARTVKRGEA